MPSEVVKRLLASTEETEEELPVKRSLKRRRKQEKPCGEDTLVKAHVRSLLLLDRKLKNYGKSAQDSLKRATKEKKLQKRRNDQPLVGRTAAAQANVLHEPTFNKKRHAQEVKKKRLRDIAKLLQKSAA